MGFWTNRERTKKKEQETSLFSSSSSSSSNNNNTKEKQQKQEQEQQHPFPHDKSDGLYRKHQGQILYDTDKRAQPHRCNDRLEDVICSFYAGGNLLVKVPKVWNTFYECLQSKEGEEPDGPYIYHTPPSSRMKKKKNNTNNNDDDSTKKRRSGGWMMKRRTTT
jgi:hypothetical protein